MHELLHTNPILHAVYHSMLMLPLLYTAYLIMEWLEHKAGERFKHALQEDRRTGPIVGATFGFIPFCGTTDLAAGLYSGRVISVGTLIALFLSTSGETLLLSASYPNKMLSVVFLLLIKFVIACICGFIIDLCLRNKQSDIHIHELCEEEHCHCEHTNIWLSALKHTLPVFGYVITFSLVLSLAELFGAIEALSSFISAFPALGVVFAALVGLIPGCASLVMLLSLYGSGVISAAALLAGLFTSVGTGFIVLFKTNKSWKQNIAIILCVFLVGLTASSIFELTGLLNYL
jgi:hypothetical protein